MTGAKQYGAAYSREKTVFSLYSPGSAAVMLQLYATGNNTENDNELMRCIPMERMEDGNFTATVEGDLHGIYYTYQLTYQSGRETISADPWAVAAGVNGVRSMVVDLRRTDPEDWANDRRITPKKGTPVVWETHVSDFSLDASSGVRPEWRGKYLAFTEKNTHLPSSVRRATCLDYLRDLGITHIQLQPIADYCTVDERTCKDYNWGYDIENYNIPEGSFSTDPEHGEVRIRECKQMIQAIHQAGLGVILDVVYNHTYHKDSWLERTAPGAYYRKNEDGEHLNASGCGNETCSERWPFRNYMVQSVLYWAREYHVDGFRFDLMGIHDVETMNLIRAELDALPDGKNIILYGEPWAAEPPAIHYPAVPVSRSTLTQLSDRVGMFSDSTRNLLSGSPFDISVKGWGAGQASDLQVRQIQSMLTGWSRIDLEHFAKAPSQVVHYVSCHDNFTLWDKLVRQTGSEDYQAQNTLAEKRNRLTSGMVLMSLGIAFFQSGEEFCRSKEGNGNSYNGPARLNRLHWQQIQKHEKLVSWYRGLIAIRNEMYPDTSKATAEKLLFLDAENGAVAFRIACPKGSRWKEILVAANPLEHEESLWMPDGAWSMLCDGMDSELWKHKTTKLCKGTQKLSPASLMIFGR